MDLKIICGWCGKFMGIKQVENATLPITHSICCKCKKQLLEETEACLEQDHQNRIIIVRR